MGIGAPDTYFSAGFINENRMEDLAPSITVTQHRIQPFANQVGAAENREPVEHAIDKVIAIAC